jgi:hypothetical protein
MTMIAATVAITQSAAPHTGLSKIDPVMLPNNASSATP